MSLSLNGVPIRQDANGLYSLNDVHRASGESRSKIPSEWLSNQQPVRIAEKLRVRTGITVLVVKNGGRNPGTYACDELVIMYSAWLDDDFHIDVLQAFRALMSGDSAKAQDIANRAFLRDEYKEMTDSLVVGRTRLGKETKSHHFKNEADMLNILAFGMTAKRFRLLNDLPDDADIRDHLDPEQKKRLLFLQRMNATLTRMMPNYQDRKDRLKELLEEEFGKEYV